MMHRLYLFLALPHSSRIWGIEMEVTLSLWLPRQPELSRERLL